MASNRNTIPPLSTLFRDPFLAAVFARAERDGGAAAEPVTPRPRRPRGGAAVTPRATARALAFA